MKTCVIHAACAALVLGLFVSAAGGEEDQVPRLSPEDFALLAWNVAGGDQKVFEGIRECGFNLAGFVRPQDLDHVAAAGLKCIVYDPRTPIRPDAQLKQTEIDEQVKAYTDNVGAHPAVFGYFLDDEPSAKQFPVLARWAKAFRSATPDKLPYINLFPNYATSEQLGADTYDGYVESFVRKLKLPYISYDHYTLMEDGSLRTGYFRNLEAIRKAATRHKIPFWNVVMSTGCLSYAEPTEAGLRFQAYTSLAYGARGISWFTYFSQPVGNFRLAPIDHFGEKTATWDMLRRVNLQIHRLGPTYLKLASVNVFHHPQGPEESRGIKTSKHLSKLTGGNFVVGEFLGPDKRPSVLVVNKDLQRSVSFQVTFRSPGTVRQINAYTGRSTPFGGEGAWLAPGQGMLLTLEQAEVGK